MSKSDQIDATEAYAFLRVLAPKLEQLRQRLVISKEHLKAADPDAGRLNAIIESQLAFREFLSNLADLNALVEPVDLLLEALRDESGERPAPTPEPTPEPPPVTPSALVAADVPSPPSTTTRAKAEPPAEAWLRVGTTVAIDMLITAGMTATNAEAYLERTYETVGLKQANGEPISSAVIGEWRNKVLGPKIGGRHRQLLKKQRSGIASAGKRPLSLMDAKDRVQEFAMMFRKMARG